jgi:hypothetical protein
LPWSREASPEEVERAQKYVVDWMRSHKPNSRGEYRIPIGAYDNSYEPAYDTVMVLLHQKGWNSVIESGFSADTTFLVVGYP